MKLSTAAIIILFVGSSILGVRMNKTENRLRQIEDKLDAPSWGTIGYYRFTESNRVTILSNIFVTNGVFRLER